MDPVTLVVASKFGNVILRDSRGVYWRICPEELECKQIAASDDEYSALWRKGGFAADWEMPRLLEDAERRYGVQPEGRCFCLKIPAVLGGGYEIENIGTISISELMRFSGNVANQVKDLPDGAQVSFRFVE